MKRNQYKKWICALLTAAMSLSGALGSMTVMAAQEEGQGVFCDMPSPYGEDSSDSGEAYPDAAYVPVVTGQDVLADVAQPEVFTDEESAEGAYGDDTGNPNGLPAADNDPLPQADDIIEEPALGDYDGSVPSGNLNAQNYIRWASPIKSYIYPENGGYLIVRATDEKLTFKNYDKDLKFIEGSERTITNPLFIFGGLYRDSAGDYFAFYGKNEPDNLESLSKKVIEIVRYDKDLKEKGKIEINGMNTRCPFKSGSLRVAEKGDYLYIRTAHKMYSDHQSNFMIEISKSEMKVTDSQYEISNLEDGFVSHSFDQYILVDDLDNIVALDHGDANPRAIVMGKYGTLAGNSNFHKGSKYESVEVLTITGKNLKNDNASGVALGGFEYSSKNYLVAGSSVDQSSKWTEADENKGRNIFVGVVARNDIKNKSVNFITAYPADSTTFASAPQMVKYDNNRFLLAWNEVKEGKANGKLCYVWIDGEGKKVGDIHTRSGYVTDCHPIVSNGSVVWFSDDDTNLSFISITPEDSEKDKKDDGPGNGGSDPGPDDPGKDDPGKDDPGKDDPSGSEETPPAGSVSADLIDGCYYVVKGSKAFIPGTRKDKGDKTYKVEYSVSKPSYLKINAKGILSARKPYDKPITISVTRNGKKSEPIKVFVAEPEIVKKLYVNKGESAQIPVTFTNKNSQAYNLKAGSFESSDPAAVSVDGSGKVSAKAGKKAKVTYTIGTKKFTTNVVVCDQTIVGSDSIEAGKTMKLKLKGAAPGAIEWKSSSDAVATVDEKGKVAALKPGKALIAATNNGKTVTMLITVTGEK